MCAPVYVLRLSAGFCARRGYFLCKWGKKKSITATAGEKRHITPGARVLYCGESSHSREKNWLLERETNGWIRYRPSHLSPSKNKKQTSTSASFAFHLFQSITLGTKRKHTQKKQTHPFDERVTRNRLKSTMSSLMDSEVLENVTLTLSSAINQPFRVKLTPTEGLTQFYYKLKTSAHSKFSSLFSSFYFYNRGEIIFTSAPCLAHINKRRAR